MPSLAQITGSYMFLLFGAEGMAQNKYWTMLVGVIFILAMTWICVIGIELNASTQFFLLAAEIIVLAVFAVVALWKVYNGDLANSVEPSWDWLNPFAISDLSALSGGMLAALFIYWGWDTAVSVNEETKDSKRTPGIAAIVSTLVLVGTYLIVAVAAQAVHGPGVPVGQRRRCVERHGFPRSRFAVRQVPDHRGAHLGCRVDPDDDSAGGAQRAVDGGPPRAPRAGSVTSTGGT